VSFVEYVIASDIGKKRSLNEDRVIYLERSNRLRLAVLADGMGGHNAGDVASEMAVKHFATQFEQIEEEQLSSVEAVKQWLKQNVNDLNYKMYQHSLTHEQCHGMGTTLIVVCILENQLVISHVGDSRVYTITNEHIQLVTKDHTYVNMLVELGHISEEEAKEHPRKNAIVKAVGTESKIEPDFYELPITQSTHILVCSDGLSNKLSDGEMAAIITLPAPMEVKGKQLIQLANDSGGEDNISLILMSFSEEEVSAC
jgi:PPM family protein phosphatase